MNQFNKTRVCSRKTAFIKGCVQWLIVWIITIFICLALWFHNVNKNVYCFDLQNKIERSSNDIILSELIQEQNQNCK